MLGIRYTADDIEKMKSSNEQVDKDLYKTLTRADYGETLVAPIWGRSEIEGRMVCEKYNVKLHVVEKHNVQGKEIWTNQIIDESGSRSVDDIGYNEANTIHIVNKGLLHFEPVLSIQGTKHREQRSLDSSDYDDEITPEEELINTVKSGNSEEEKLKKIKKLFEKAPKPNINFQGANNDTPLHIAVRRKELKIIEFLVENEANINIKNDKGRTPLDIAEQRLKRQDIVQMLKRSTSQSQQKISGAGEGKKPEVEKSGVSNSGRQSSQRLGSSGQVGRLNPKQQSTDYNNQVNERLEEFVGYFVKKFEAKLSLYYMILEGEVKGKTGKFSDTFSSKIGKAIGGAIGGGFGALLVPFVGPTALGAGGAALGEEVVEAGGNKLGERHNRKKAVSIAEASIWFPER